MVAAHPLPFEVSSSPGSSERVYTAEELERARQKLLACGYAPAVVEDMLAEIDMTRAEHEAGLAEWEAIFESFPQEWRDGFDRRAEAIAERERIDARR